MEPAEDHKTTANFHFAASMIREAIAMLVEHDGLTMGEAITGAQAAVTMHALAHYGPDEALARAIRAAVGSATTPMTDAASWHAPATQSAPTSRHLTGKLGPSGRGAYAGG